MKRGSKVICSLVLKTSILFETPLCD